MANRIVKITDEFDTCSCCGRQGLKRVAMVQPLDACGNPEGYPYPMGMTCAANNCGFGKVTQAKATKIIETELSKYKAKLKAKIISESTVTSFEYGFNNFNVTTFTGIINGQEVRLCGNHVNNWKLEMLKSECIKEYAEQVSKGYRK